MTPDVRSESSLVPALSVLDGARTVATVVLPVAGGHRGGERRLRPHT